MRASGSIEPAKTRPFCPLTYPFGTFAHRRMGDIFSPLLDPPFLPVSGRGGGRPGLFDICLSVCRPLPLGRDLAMPGMFDGTCK